MSFSAVVVEVSGANTEYLEETKKKKRKEKDFREEKRPRDKEKHHVELQETNGVESPSQMGNTGKQISGNPSTGVIIYSVVDFIDMCFFCSVHWSQPQFLEGHSSAVLLQP